MYMPFLFAFSRLVLIFFKVGTLLDYTGLLNGGGGGYNSPVAGYDNHNVPIEIFGGGGVYITILLICRYCLEY